jgi:hypothetical protein
VNTLPAYRGQRFVQGVEDVNGADNVAQAVAVQVGPQRGLRVYENQCYAAGD